MGDPGEDLTPQDLVEIERISRVKHAYLRCLDQKDWDGLDELLTEDATASFSGGNYSFDGRSEIVGFLARNMGSEAFHSSHRVHQPEIDVDGDVAKATWALEDIVVDSEWGFVLFGAAFYEDTFRKVDGRWRISHTGYRRSFEAMLPTANVEGFQLTASWWATGGRSTLPVQ